MSPRSWDPTPRAAPAWAPRRSGAERRAVSTLKPAKGGTSARTRPDRRPGRGPPRPFSCSP